MRVMVILLLLEASQVSPAMVVFVVHSCKGKQGHSLVSKISSVLAGCFHCPVRVRDSTVCEGGRRRASPSPHPVRRHRLRGATSIRSTQCPWLPFQTLIRSPHNSLHKSALPFLRWMYPGFPHEAVKYPHDRWVPITHSGAATLDSET